MVRDSDDNHGVVLDFERFLLFCWETRSGNRWMVIYFFGVLVFWYSGILIWMCCLLAGLVSPIVVVTVTLEHCCYSSLHLDLHRHRHLHLLSSPIVISLIISSYHHLQKERLLGTPSP